MSNSPDMVTTALNLFFALIIVLVSLLLLFYLFKKGVKKYYNNSDNKLIKVLDSTFIGVKKNISLVEVPGAVLVLGITNDNISFLTRIDRKDITKELHETGSMKQGSFFAEKLGNIILKGKR
ncbi:MAG: flagellar biosynthetic protein FliO [Deltaproteobacteria bacterium]|nr:flagellar biosynthetic protein FliO [Deltaproteobacteria bacterium]